MYWLVEEELVVFTAKHHALLTRSSTHYYPPFTAYLIQLLDSLSEPRQITKPSSINPRIARSVFVAKGSHIA